MSASCDDVGEAVAYARPDGFVLRARADGSDPVVVADGVTFPNCMALDRQETFLYVVRTTPAAVVRFAVRPDRTLGPGEQFGPDLGERRPDEIGAGGLAGLADPATMRRWGLADGCAFDAEGNLWVTIVGPNRIVALTPDGDVVTILEDLDGDLLHSPTSLAWGGPDRRDLYIGSLWAPYVLRGRSSVPGLAMVHQG